MSQLSTQGSLVAHVSLVLAAAIAPSIGSAQGLPAAKDLIARYVAETGADAWKSHKSSRMKATMDMPAAGMSASMEVLHVYPNRVFTKVDVPGMGMMTSGFDGENAWSVNPMTGPRVLSGPELAAVRAESDPSASYSRQSADITSSETVEKTTLGGQECYKVKHTWKSGKITFDCFSVTDGLMVATQSRQSTPMGELEMLTTLSAYKDFGGFKRPTTLTQEVMGQQQIITISAWEWDNVDAKEMELPTEIKAMLTKK
ncbi:MAG: hypothetical protein MNPFHGCM_00899 [Gemmatimonadaceae bacterium]|nr:hypothetical protein [Gemmatimonadaceae bacterium]